MNIHDIIFTVPGFSDIRIYLLVLIMCRVVWLLRKSSSKIKVTKFCVLPLVKIHTYMHTHTCTYTEKWTHMHTHTCITQLYIHIICNVALLCVCSVEYDADEGRNEYQEEIYEHQIRLPFTSFGKCKSFWTNLVSFCLYMLPSG